MWTRSLQLCKQTDQPERSPCRGQWWWSVHWGLPCFVQAICSVLACMGTHMWFPSTTKLWDGSARKKKMMEMKKLNVMPTLILSGLGNGQSSPKMEISGPSFSLLLLPPVQVAEPSWWWSEMPCSMSRCWSRTVVTWSVWIIWRNSFWTGLWGAVKENGDTAGKTHHFCTLGHLKALRVLDLFEASCITQSSLQAALSDNSLCSELYPSSALPPPG